MSCPECGGELPAGAATGRPLMYCGDACRRSAQYRIARARRLAERLEWQLVGARVAVKTVPPYTADTEKRRVKALEAELAIAEERVLKLMRGDVDVPAKTK